MIEGKTKKIRWDSNTEPPKNFVWAKSDDEFLEYKNGKWDKSEEISPAGSGDEFPYEYACPDDFSVTVQYEDWENLEEEPYCEIHIDEIDIPENITTYFYCVNGSKGSDSECAYVKIGSSKQYITVEVAPLIDDNKLSGFSFCGHERGTTIIQQASPITFNFTDMLFIGEKKTNE